MTTNQVMTNQVNTNQTTIQGEKNMKIEINILNSTSQMTTIMTQPKETQHDYTNCLTFKQLEELDVFDDIPHKWLKTQNKDDDIEVEIIDLECDRPNWCKTLFNFELTWGLYTEHFNVVLDYNNSGFHALYIMDLRNDNSDEEDEVIITTKDDESDDESEVEVSDEEEEESEEERHEDDYRDYTHRVEDEPIGYFNICGLDLFTSDYPRSEFNQLKEELELDGFLEVLIFKEKEEWTGTMPPYMSDIYLSIGNNKRTTYNSYNTSSPFAMWLSEQELHYYADEEEEEDIQENVEPSQ